MLSILETFFRGYIIISDLSDSNFFRSNIFYLLKLSIHKLLIHTNKRCKLRKYLIFYRLLDSLLFFVTNFRVRHQLLHIFVILYSDLKISNYFMVRHFVDKWHVKRLWVDMNFSFIFIFIQTVLVTELKFSLLA